MNRIHFSRSRIETTVLVVAATILSVFPAASLAGGSCNVNAECNDGNDCTSDTCNLISHLCQHNPVAPGTACGDLTNTPCTNPDTCNASGVCLRNDEPPGTACSLPNVCIIDEVCANGFCVGVYNTGCCNGDPSCDDHNACTTEVCVGNACQRTNVAPGMSCGSSVNDECTDPDTCNGLGACLTNDTSDGTDCGGPDCLGGECGATTFQATSLPEGGNIGDEPRDGFIEDTVLPAVYIVGRVIGGGSVDHAAVWECDGFGANCTLTALPEGGAGTSVANGAACIASDDCLAVGSKGSPSQPAAWWYNGVTWVAETVPMPGGFTGGTIAIVADTASGILNVAGTSPAYASVGDTVNPSGFRKATYWIRDDLGTWSVFVLDDFGVPGRDGMATGIVQCAADSPTNICDNGELLIAGWAENDQGIARPVIWREMGASSGTFEMTQLPLPAGSVQIVELGDLLTLISILLPSVQEGSGPIYLSGTVEMTDGSTRAVAWRTEDFSSWTSTVLPTLPGSDSTYGTRGASIGGGQNTIPVFGSSYPTGGDPLLDGTATHWIIDPDTLGLSSGPTDANVPISGLPLDCHYSTLIPVRTVSVGLSVNGGYTPPSLRFGTTSCAAAVAGTSQPHGASAFSAPIGAPIQGDDTCQTTISDTGLPCSTDADCGLCVGGANNGLPCNSTADCPGGACSACGLKSRYLSITPTNAGVAGGTSIQVEVVTCPQFSFIVGDIFYVGVEQSIPNAPLAALRGAPLECTLTPNSQVWTTGPLHLFGQAVVPGSTYHVRMCDGVGGNCSDPLLVATAKWGDVIRPFGGGSQPNFADINSIIQKFGGQATAPAMPRVDLVGTGNPGNPNTPNQVANFADISNDVSAFGGFAYAYTVPSCPP